MVIKVMVIIAFLGKCILILKFNTFFLNILIVNILVIIIFYGLIHLLFY